MAFQAQAQSNTNGNFDSLEDLSTIVTVPLTMPDGTQLMTDMYYPITSDSLVLPISLGATTANLELIPRGVQLVIYDSLNNAPNPNPYKLPLIFTRTPYGKNGDIVGRIVCLLGYSYALQDMRGRYESEGVYFPMLSDSWQKTPYHPNSSHLADITPLSDPRNSNKHEDGYNSIQSLLQLYRPYDLNHDGVTDTVDKAFNGNIGMFGASALGNTQLQAAAAHRIDPAQPGLKCLLPIVATNEHFKSTGYNNGVLRERIVSGWVRGQVYDLDDNAAATDSDIDNTIHSPADYNMTSKQLVAEACIDHFSAHRYNGGLAASYPNGAMRSEMDASAAPVDENGNGAANGQYSRYSNVEVPAFHLSGWWDIFVNGQIETHKLTMQHLSDQYGNKKFQKLVIGPYAHQTIGSTTTGDVEYPQNATDIIGVNIEDVDINNLNITDLSNSEVLSWYRYHLNQRQGLKEPKIRIPRSEKWQDFGALGQIRVPAEDYTVTFTQFFNLLAGFADGLPTIKAESTVLGNLEFQLSQFITEPILGDVGLDQPLQQGIREVDFEQVPNVRCYIAGPVNDGIADNATKGNYWYSADAFPPNDSRISHAPIYLHADGSISPEAPTTDEGNRSLIHDPNNPVKTVGGANMIVNLIDANGNFTNECCSQGQMNLANPTWAPYTLDNQGVLQFETDLIEDSLSIIGTPVANIYASSHPEGGIDGAPTDTDFFVRVLDVYPDGRELFVVEGAVNARARDYAKYIVDHSGEENRNMPFTNINIGQVYEYRFEMLPIGYTFGKGHKVKVLISSGNWNRYQANPNLPIEEGDFFRRVPNDGKTYNYQGVEMSPRVAINRLYSSPQYPSGLILPVLGSSTVVSTVQAPAPHTAPFTAILSPNPTADIVRVFASQSGNTLLQLTNMLGQTILQTSFNQQTELKLGQFPRGIYLLTLRQGGQTYTQKIIRQ